MKKVLLFIIMFLIFLNVGAIQNDKKIVATYFNLDGVGKITIDVSNGFNATLTENMQDKEIQIKDQSIYQSIFLSGKNESFPKYILNSNDSYLFSDFSKSDSVVSNKYILSSKIHDLSMGDLATNISSCDSLLGYKLINLLKNNVFKLIYYIIPIILIITSTFDFTKLVFSDDKEGVPGAFTKLIKRSIISILIFLIPSILIFIINIFGTDEVKTCIETFKSTENLN